MISNSNPSRRNGAPNRRFGLALVTLTLAAAVLVPVAEAQGPPLKVAVVNLDYVVAASPAGQDLQKKLEAFTTEVRQRVAEMGGEANEVRQQMANGANTLSEDRLQAMQQQFEDKQIAIRRYQDDKQREGQKMQEDGLKEIEQQLQPIFEAVTAEEGFDLILNNVPGVVVMAGPRVDITQKVIDRMNAANPAGDGS